MCKWIVLVRVWPEMYFEHQKNFRKVDVEEQREYLRVENENFKVNVVLKEQKVLIVLDGGVDACLDIVWVSLNDPVLNVEVRS